MSKFKFVRLDKDEADTAGSSLKGKLKYGIQFDDLYNIFGPPTISEGTSDGKVNFEWVVEFETEENGIQLFTIYDWKVDREWSINNTGHKSQSKEWLGGSRWHVGGKDYAGDFIEFLEKELKKFEKELPF